MLYRGAAREGERLHPIARHMFVLFTGEPSARAGRRTFSRVNMIPRNPNDSIHSTLIKS
jgi:hypothetical protein